MTEQINQGKLSERLYYEREHFIFEGSKGKRGRNHVGPNPPVQKGIRISNHRHKPRCIVVRCPDVLFLAILSVSSRNDLPSRDNEVWALCKTFH